MFYATPNKIPQMLIGNVFALKYLAVMFYFGKIYIYIDSSYCPNCPVLAQVI